MKDEYKKGGEMIKVGEIISSITIYSFSANYPTYKKLYQCEICKTIKLV